MAIPTKTVSVQHLNGSLISYAALKPITSTKPTVALIHSFATSATLFKPQFSDPTLLDAVNLIALEPFGHGNTKANRPTFTYWDSAIAFVQALDKLGVNKFFVLGASQGGFIAARMALYAPDRVRPSLLCPLNALVVFIHNMDHCLSFSLGSPV
jgi:pimeloyl-ACP methyl ester carboxylesterase